MNVLLRHGPNLCQPKVPIELLKALNNITRLHLQKNQVIKQIFHLYIYNYKKEQNDTKIKI